MILPHGGELINRVVPEREKLKIVEDVKKASEPSGGYGQSP
jgi:sulfate adenylyltransferase